MASILKKGDKWQARVIRKGFPAQNKSFDSKTEAQAWATEIEAAMQAGTFAANQADLAITLGELIDRYLDSDPTLHVLPNGPLVTKNTTYLKCRLLRLKERLGQYSVENLTPQVLSKYRDERLKVVCAGTLLREIAVLEGLFKRARRDWDMTLPNPFGKFIKPKYFSERDRILTDTELDRLWVELKSRDELWEPRKAKNSINPHLLPLAKLALETAMRRSEMLELTWDRVDLERRVAYLTKTKNGKPRTVPLSSTAIAIFQEVRAAREKMPLEGIEAASNRVFPISYRVVDQAWMRAVKRAKIKDFRFHDLRHMAITNMSKKIPNVIELSRISGHSNLKMLARYYSTRPEDLALKLG
ncbi:site-specific integrase [Burkholderia guangdongensis]|uniref:site-specific integrase n=1 Tax=Burkholderia guangdongensis TaxID=1792500 RepID=UPI0015CB2D7E|nr:site-specific integrase [Burkholderia guangdongensis]